MNTDGLKTIISKRFNDDLVDVRPNIFKINRRYNSKSFAAHYFDCSENFLDEDFDLDEYQRTLLAEDYYANAGPLQWNYYLYFVAEKPPTASKKNAIESNKTFTRKYVATPEEVIRIVETQTRLREHPKEKLDDALVTVWKNRLKEAQIEGIYLTNDYPKINDVFQRFIDNAGFEERAEVDRNVSESEIATSTIAEISLEAFRSFNNTRLKFKKVNLLRGVNGVGKTSLMEAIELCLCGQTIENPSKKESAKTLQIKYSNGSIDVYSPEDTKKFQARDRAWYGNNTLRGNSLSQGFHIYNFFDSDAAFRFTNESNSGEAVKQIFSRVVLGEQANIIFNRVERFYEKLVTELKTAQKVWQGYLERRLEYQTKIKEFESGAEIITALGDIINALDRRDWKGVNLFLTETSNRIQFQIELAKINQFLNEVNDLLPPTGSTLKILYGDLLKLEELIGNVRAIQSSFDEYLAQNIKLQSSQKVLLGQIKVIERSEKYFKVPEVGKIKGIKERLQGLRQRLSKAQSTQQLLQGLTELKDKKLSDAQKEIEETIETNKKNLDGVKKEMFPIEQTLGVLNKLKVELTKNAEEFIKLSNDYEHCPVCQTIFPEKNVLYVISSAASELKEAELFRNFSEKKSALETEIENYSMTSEALSTIQLSIMEILNGDIGNSTLYEFELEIANVIAQTIEEGKNLRRLSDSFIESSLDELEFDAINRELSAVGVDLQIGKSTLEDFRKVYQSLKTQDADLHEKEISLQQTQDTKEREIFELSAAYLKEPLQTDLMIDKLSAKLSERKRRILEVLEQHRHINTLIDIDEEESLIDLQSEFEAIRNQFDAYLEIESKNRLKREYTENLRVLQLNIEDVEKKIDRYMNASLVLKDIIENNNRENYLRDFFIQNKWSILDIFKVIHTPNEFEDILFESSEAIKLKVKGKTELRDLSEISTGQKSAFILSLFMSLNSNLVSGPPIIMFDDPIAHVDDINTLSFLDFLRETVIAKDTQLFFATANNKLANLFQQKFNFLENDFEIIQLSTASQDNT